MEKRRVAWLSVGSNTLLTAGKLVAGFATGSVSILSEAAHSAIDLIAAGIATFSVHVADRPPDHTHPYGHEKIENISGVIEGLLVFGAAVWIIYEAVDKLLHGVDLKYLDHTRPYGHEKIENISGVIEGLLIFGAAVWIIYEAVDKLLHGVDLKYLGHGLVVLGISGAMNMVVATLLKKSAIRNRSVALEADAAHLYADVYTSLGVFVGLGIITVGDRFFKADLAWLDPVIAIGVAVLILATAYRITRKSFYPLLDSAASPGGVSRIEGIMNEFSKDGVDFHKLRTRRAGGSLYVDLHMGFKTGMSLEQGHETSPSLTTKVEEKVPGAKALVHLEPSSTIETIPEEDERVKCMREELLKDLRVCEVRNLRATRYR